MENAKRAKGRDKMSNLGNTQYFKVPQEQKLGVEEILERVYQALAEKGYNQVILCPEILHTLQVIIMPEALL